MASLPAFRVLETCQVSPPPASVAEPNSLPLTFFEIIWLYASPVERVFFYRLPLSTSSFVDSLLPALKSSLSLALQHFYPLAGKIRRSPGSSNNDYRYELHYADGDSVSLVVAEYDADFDDLCGSHARDMARLLPLLPELPSCEDVDAVPRPVLALQATVFPGRGVAVGVAVHHSACDGSGFMHFMASWASACRSAGSTPVAPPSPVFDKSLVPDPRGLYSIYVSFMMRLIRDPLPRSTQDDTAGDVVLASFVLSQDQIKRLKDLVVAKSGGGETAPPFHCSTIVVVYSYVWTCLARAQSFDSDKTAHLAFAADYRGRLSPPLPAGYFGSCVGPCFVEAKAGDIIDEGCGFLAACEATGRAIESLKDEGLDGAEGWIERLLAISTQQAMSVAGSPKFRVYSTDFGWGRPKKVEVASIRKTGAISLAENPQGEEGGVEIGVVLPKNYISAFGTCFSNGLRVVLG